MIVKEGQTNEQALEQSKDIKSEITIFISEDENKL